MSKNITAKTTFANFELAISRNIEDKDIDATLAKGVIYDAQRELNSKLEKLFWPTGAKSRPEGFKRFEIPYSAEGAASITAKAKELGYAVVVTQYVPGDGAEKSRKQAERTLAQFREFDVLGAFLAKHGQQGLTDEAAIIELIHQKVVLGK